MSVLIIDSIKYNKLVLKEEKQLEDFVKTHYSEIFGNNSLYFDIKPELRSKAGIGSKPDGIVVIFEKPSYCIVENERAEHGIHDHVVTQISKFSTAFKKPETQKKIIEAIYEEIHDDPSKELFVKSRAKGDLHKFLTDLFSSKPVVVIIIDELLDELEEAVEELPLECRIIEFKTFAREDAPSIHAHLFDPLSGSSRKEEVMTTSIEEKKKEMLDRMKPDEVRVSFSEFLMRLELMHLQVKPLSGCWLSVWSKGKRFMYIAARQKFFRVFVQKPDGKWFDGSNVRNEQELESLLKNRIVPTVDEFRATI